MSSTEARETTNPMRVLEIGYGVSPALTSGGSLFDGDNLQYIGVDLPTTWWKLHDDARKRIVQARLNANFAYANAGALPIKDNKIDLILMRSVFGHFRGRDFDKVSNTSIDNLREGGLYESFRVLKPDGKIIIFEENTPMDSREVEKNLKLAGFIVEDFREMSGSYYDLPSDDPWKQFRNDYYQTPPLLQIRAPEWPYILVGKKPRNPNYIQLKGSIQMKYREGNILTVNLPFLKGAQNNKPSIIEG